MDIKLISFDMFQTLVDVNSIKYDIWKIILNKDYTPEYTDELWEITTQKLVDYFNNDIKEDDTFRSVKYIYEKCYSEVFRDYGIEFDPEEAAKKLAECHNHAQPFDDAEEFVEYIENKYMYCISSDTDSDMIVKNKFTRNCHKVFTSEDLKTYKFYKENIFFRSVLDYFNCKAEEIIHIGDSASDIVNPKKLGMKTCWVNRNDRPWDHDVQPDIICKELTELMGIL